MDLVSTLKTYWRDFIAAGTIAMSSAFALHICATREPPSHPAPQKRSIVQARRSALATSLLELGALIGLGAGLAYILHQTRREDSKNPLQDFEGYLVKHRGAAALAVYSASLKSLILDFPFEDLDMQNAIPLMSTIPPLTYIGARITLWKDEYRYPRQANWLRSLGLCAKITSRASLSPEELDRLETYFADPAAVQLQKAAYHLARQEILQGVDCLEQGLPHIKSGPSSLEDYLQDRIMIVKAQKTLAHVHPEDLGRHLELAFTYHKIGRSDKALDTIHDCARLGASSPEILCSLAFFTHALASSPKDAGQNTAGKRLRIEARQLHQMSLENILRTTEASAFRKLKSSEAEVLELQLNPFLNSKYILERSKDPALIGKYETTCQVYEQVRDARKVCRPIHFTQRPEDGLHYASYLRAQGKPLAELSPAARGALARDVLTLYDHILRVCHDLRAPSLVYEDILEQKIAQRLGKTRSQKRAIREALLDCARYLDGRPKRFIHNNLHPGNVIVGSQGPCVIDFGDAREGLPAGDAVQLLLSVDIIPRQAEIMAAMPSSLGDLESEELIRHRVFKGAQLAARSWHYDEPNLEQYRSEYERACRQLGLPSTSYEPLLELTHK